MQNAIEKIIESHGLTVQEFCSYQRAYPQMRAEIHSATLEIFEKVNGMNVMQLSKWIKSRGYKGDRDKVRRMLAGADVDQLPAHYSSCEFDKIKEMVLSGKTYDQIAEAIGRSKASVVAKATWKKINMQRINPDLYRICKSQFKQI